MPRKLARIRRRVLGTRYDLSFSFISAPAIRTLNRRYRRKDHPTDILAFPLNKTQGEMLICKSEVKKRASAFGMTPAGYLEFLFIHGALHLKGLEHGRIMEKLEDRWCRVFGVPLPKR